MPFLLSKFFLRMPNIEKQGKWIKKKFFFFFKKTNKLKKLPDVFIKKKINWCILGESFLVYAWTKTSH